MKKMEALMEPNYTTTLGLGCGSGEKLQHSLLAHQVPPSSHVCVRVSFHKPVIIKKIVQMDV